MLAAPRVFGSWHRAPHCSPLTSARWCCGITTQLKPDYVQEQEIDALIIGGYYGTGRNGGKIAEFLLGIAVPSPYGDTSRPHFASFSRVSTHRAYSASATQ